jgi:hypothetical protein
VNRLRVTAPADAPPIPIDLARDQAREQFRSARNTYVDLLGVFGGYRLHWLLRSEEKVTVRALRSTREEAQRMAEHALALVAALEACIDTCERAAK